MINSKMRTIMSRPEIEADLQSYVQSAAMPCPYARLPTSYVHLDEEVESQRTREWLRCALSEFWPDESQKILSIVPRNPPRNHLEARKQAYWLRYQWHYLHLEESGLLQCEGEEADAKLKELYSGWMSDTLSFVGPRIMVGKADIMMTAFNPLYDRDHSRYAPHAVFPVIRAKDLLGIHETRPEVSFDIATRAKCKIIFSMLKNRDGITVSDMRKEYREWLEALSYYRDFVTTIYTDSYRVDPRTLPRLRENRKISNECIESRRFKASLVAFRALIINSPNIPSLKRILTLNPEVTVFDIAKVVYGDVSGLYVLP